MAQILVISGHPNLKESHTLGVILEQLQTSFTDIEIRNLWGLLDQGYDVAAEQAALVKAEAIVLNTRSTGTPCQLLKLWLDEVFTHNFHDKGDN